MKYIITEDQYNLISKNSNKNLFFERLINDYIEELKGKCEDEGFAEDHQLICSCVSLINSISIFESEVGNTIRGKTYLRISIIINSISETDVGYGEFLRYVAEYLNNIIGMYAIFLYKIHKD